MHRVSVVFCTLRSEGKILDRVPRTKKVTAIFGFCASFPRFAFSVPLGSDALLFDNLGFLD